ncbi:MAG: hypothetical protein EHM33_25245 [Chloroflexi bacterium]|nr:MAG: hypothetical protein EHM33_25245 [Chloroflexota bacterium]
MKQRWVWVGLIAAGLAVIALVTWRLGILSRLYRTFVPVGEISAAQVRGLNNLGLPQNDPDEFDFFVAGHLYGSQEIKDRQPDAALLAALPALSQASPDFLVSLGDMVEQSNAEEFGLLESTFLSQVSFPVFNTVGNHDVTDRSLYEARYGQTFFTFKYGPARLIFLDTEKAKCKLDEPQNYVLTTAVASALRDREVRYIFVFMHKTLFFQNEVLAAQRDRMAGPNEWKCYGSKTFQGLMDEVLIPAAAQKPVYLFAGDVGAWGNLTPYYEQHPHVPLTMLMTGLGDTSQDNILHIHVDESGVTFESIFLNDMTSQPLEEFGPAYWDEIATKNSQPIP